MIETFLNVPGRPSLLRIETTKEQREIKIPPFISIEKEVTLDPDYSSRSLAKGS